MGAIPHVRRPCQYVERLTTTRLLVRLTRAALPPLGLDKPGRTGYGRAIQVDMDGVVRGLERKETTCGTDQ